MSAPTTRRGLLAGGATLAALAPVAAIARNGDAAGADAELIQACAEHCVNMDAYNNAPIETEEALWLAYCETRDFISEAKPQTLAGVVAKARAARHEAVDRNGKEHFGGSMGEAWAFDLVNDLLRVTGGAA